MVTPVAKTRSTVARRWTGIPAEERRAERRRLLIDTAFDLLGTEGTAGTTVRAVCQAAQLNPRYFYESFEDLDALIVAVYDRLVAEQGWATEIRTHGALARWGVIVGPEVAQHVSPVSFEQGEDGKPGRLVVKADSTAWATQMRLLAAAVVKRLNEELGDGTVGLIDVQGPSGPTWKKGLRSVRGGRGPRDTYG